jgi:hypothetical protein
MLFELEKLLGKRLRVEINTDLPLVWGFLIPRPDKDPLWVSFKYERLEDYCSLCGLIGHRNFNCPTANSVIPMENFGMSLKAMAFTSPCPVSTGVFEASDSGTMSGVFPPAIHVLSNSSNSSGCTSGQIIKASFAHHVASPYQSFRPLAGSSCHIALKSNPLILAIHRWTRPQLHGILPRRIRHPTHCLLKVSLSCMPHLRQNQSCLIL